MPNDLDIPNLNLNQFDLEMQEPIDAGQMEVKDTPTFESADYEEMKDEINNATNDPATSRRTYAMCEAGAGSGQKKETSAVVPEAPVVPGAGTKSQ
jgi:hypothetical protein